MLRTILFFLAALGALFVAAALFANKSHSAPPENSDPALAPWYQSLKQPGSGVSCCSIADCRPVDYRTENGHYEAWYDDKWLLIPDSKILSAIPNPVGRGVLCYTPALGVMCFVRATEI